jgi:hypothetical protein
VIHQDFDLTGITRFVLGLYWRVVSPAERRQFRKGPKGGVWLAKRDRLIAERADKRGAVAPRNDQDLARPCSSSRSSAAQLVATRAYHRGS